MSNFLSLFLTVLLLCLIPDIYSFQYKSVVTNRKSHLQLKMGNNAAFGIFSPAVYAAKFVLGEAKLNKVFNII